MKKKRTKKMGIKYSKSDIILAALSATKNEGQKYDAVQVQKLFFLIDEEAANKINGKKFFDFKPYNYGPFDKEVYWALSNLSTDGKVIIDGNKYMLSLSGDKEGNRIFETLPENIRDFIKEINKFVTELSFRELVAAIYKKYPKMKKNSIFFG